MTSETIWMLFGITALALIYLATVVQCLVDRIGKLERRNPLPRNKKEISEYAGEVN